MDCSTNQNSSDRSEILLELTIASEQVESLLVQVPCLGLDDALSAIVTWLWNTRQVMDRTTAWIASHREEIEGLKSAREVERYRAKLELLRHSIQSLEESLVSRRAAIQAEQRRLKKTQDWALTVKKLG